MCSNSSSSVWAILRDRGHETLMHTLCSSQRGQSQQSLEQKLKKLGEMFQRQENYLERTTGHFSFLKTSPLCPATIDLCWLMLFYCSSVSHSLFYCKRKSLSLTWQRIKHLSLDVDFTKNISFYFYLMPLLNLLAILSMRPYIRRKKNRF